MSVPPHIPGLLSMKQIAKRSLQTSVLIGKPLKSKNDRFRVLAQEIDSRYQTLKMERRENLLKLPAEERETTQFGQILPIKKMLSLIESVTTWDSMKVSIAFLKEMRYLGAPKRIEISDQIVKQLASLYLNQPDDTQLVTSLIELLMHEQTNPLVLTSNANANENENIKMVIDTGLDIEAHLFK